MRCLRNLGNPVSARQSSATDRALNLVSQGMTRYAAAKKVGIALSTIYNAVKRQQAKKPTAR